MRKSKGNTKRIHVAELILYIVSAVALVVGLTSLTFGIVGHHINVPLEDNWIIKAETSIVLDFRIWGIIIISSAALVSVVTLVAFASGADRQYEKSLRRQQRLSSSAINEMEIKPAVETIEVESNPVKNE